TNDEEKENAPQEGVSPQECRGAVEDAAQFHGNRTLQRWHGRHYWHAHKGERAKEASEAQGSKEAEGKALMPRRPLFSILHPSARPDKWRQIYDAWMSACEIPEQVEYLLGTDQRWGFDPVGRVVRYEERGELNRVIENDGRRCYVDAVNNLAKHA